MKKSKILLSFALLCSPFWLTAAQNSGASQNSSAASSAQNPRNPTTVNSAPQGNTVVSPATKDIAQNSMPQSGSAANSTLQGFGRR